MGQSKISNTEWGLVIGALFTVDGAQALLNFFAIGVIFNRLISIFVGMSLALYLKLRGELDWKAMVALIITFFGEEAPLFDTLPFWGGLGLYYFGKAKSKKVLAQVPGGKVISSATGINDKKAA